MKNFNTNTGAGNTHAQTEQKQYVTGVILHKLSGQKTDYQLHINTTNPKVLTDKELLKLPEVIKALEAKNVSLTEKQLLSVETGVNTDLQGNATSYTFNVFFNAPTDNRLPKGKTTAELAKEFSKYKRLHQKEQKALKNKVNAMTPSEKEAYHKDLDTRIEASNEALRKMQVNKAEVFIDADGSLEISSKEAFKAPYYPDLTTDVIEVNSLQLDKNYTASELLDLISYNANDFQLLSFIAKEGNGNSMPDEFKYTLYLMRR